MVVLAVGASMIFGIAMKFKHPAPDLDVHRTEQPSGATAQTPARSEVPAAQASADESGDESTFVHVPVDDGAPPSTVTLPVQTGSAHLGAPKPPPVQVAGPAPIISTPPAPDGNTVFSAFPSPKTTPSSAANSNKEPNPSPTPEPHTVTLSSGTILKVRLTQPVSTDGGSKGQLFNATLLSPIVQDGYVIADSGAPVTGEIVESKRAGKFGGTADLQLVLVEMHTTDQQDVRIESTSWNDHGRSHRLITAPFRVLGALSGSHGSGAQEYNVAAVHGRNITLPADTVLQFELAAPVSLTEHVH